MSLRSPVVYAIPQDTEQAARASFPKGHSLMRIADEFGLLYSNSQFSLSFRVPASQPLTLLVSPWLLCSSSWRD